MTEPLRTTEGRSRRWLGIAAIALATAIVLVTGALLVSRHRNGAPSGAAGPSLTSSASAAPGDGVLRTPGCATYVNQGPTQIQGTPVSGNDEIVNALDRRIEPYARKNFADVWAEPMITDQGRLRIFRKPSAAFDAWIMHDFASDCVEIADAKASAAEMEQQVERVVNDGAYWRSQGIQINSAGGDAINGRVMVFVPPDEVAKAQQLMPQHYPDLKLAIGDR
jgi:hypothetical protein